jgi:hypothetical protein
MITAEQIMEMYEAITSRVESLNDEKSVNQIKKLFEDFSDRIIETPGNGNTDLAYCYPGGYIYELYDIITTVEQLCNVWETTCTQSLIKSTILHSLGKLGDENGSYFIPTKDKWRLDRGEKYEYNNNIVFMLVPDRTFYLIQKYGIILTQNEYLNIKLINGLYDESNDKYLRTTKNSAGIEHIILRQAKEIANNKRVITQIKKAKQQPKREPEQVNAKLNNTVLNLLNTL